MTKMKFCGLKRPCDVETVNEIKPDYIGFVFVPTRRRYIPPEEAAKLKQMLSPEIQAVGVFIDETPEKVAKLLNDGIIDMAQLHGSEDEAYIAKLRTLSDKPIIKAIKAVDYLVTTSEHTGSDETPDASGSAVGDIPANNGVPTDPSASMSAAPILDVARIESCSADYILLDSGAGTGKTFDWNLIRGISRPYFLAGGLDIDNAPEAIRTLHPFALDVSSGIETDGLKDKTKMAAFAAAVRKEETA